MLRGLRRRRWDAFGLRVFAVLLERDAQSPFQKREDVWGQIHESKAHTAGCGVRAKNRPVGARARVVHCVSFAANVLDRRPLQKRGDPRSRAPH